MDKLTPARRSENMRRITSKNTAPELHVRKILTGLRYRYRLHGADLPGKPDIVFPGRRKVILVHGCFWHAHAACREGRTPASKRGYWAPKLVKNKARDRLNKGRLTRQGWRYMVVWECDLNNAAGLTKRIQRFLER